MKKTEFQKYKSIFAKLDNKMAKEQEKRDAKKKAKSDEQD